MMYNFALVLYKYRHEYPENVIGSVVNRLPTKRVVSIEDYQIQIYKRLATFQRTVLCRFQITKLNRTDLANKAASLTQT
jgi:hypothetical protein